MAFPYINIKGSLFFLLLIITINGYSQSYVHEVSQVTLRPSETTWKLDVPKKSTFQGNQNRIVSAIVTVQMDMLAHMEDYVFSKSDITFDYSFTFKIRIFKKGSSVSLNESAVSHTLRVVNSKPVSLVQFDLAKLLGDVAINDLSKVEIDLVSLSELNNLAAHLNRSAKLDVAYSHGVTLNVGEDATLENEAPETLFPLEVVPFSVDLKNKVIPVDGGRTIEFKWISQYPYTLYQLQILKLNNIDPAKKDETAISAEIDWSKSIMLDIPVDNALANGVIVCDHRENITIGEGSGFYAWRVRPVGNYFEGGVANSSNWGEWSTSINGLQTLDLAILNDPLFFYFSDPDDPEDADDKGSLNRNRIFSRVFTEDNKIKEVTTYANSLNQVKQVKTFTPSNNVTLTTQSVTDYSGRAAINTLPMPSTTKRDKYTEGFITSNGKVYSASNFDGKPSADLIDNTNSVNYYSGFYSDPRIPSAGQVPFTQTTFYQDPLNRTKQEGGAGEVFKIKGDGNPEHNVTFYYGVPSQTELTQLFGADAPDNESVSKMVKVDPNNIATITYTSAEGKVLASCISFLDDSNTLDPLKKDVSDNTTEGNAIKEFQVVDNLSNSVKTEWGFLSSKRIVILQPTDININYAVDQTVIDGLCGKFSLESKYTVDIKIRKVDSDELPIVVALNQELNKENPFKTVKKHLDKGTYVIEKILRLGDVTVNLDGYQKGLEDAILPLVELVGWWSDGLTCKSQVPKFQERLRLLQQFFEQKRPLTATEDFEFLSNLDGQFNKLDPRYVRLKAFFNVTYKDAIGAGKFYSLDRFGLGVDNYLDANSTQSADRIVIHSTCCDVDCSVKWIKKFNQEVKPVLKYKGHFYEPKNVRIEEDKDIPDYEIAPDFEGYAMAYFEDCEVLNNGKFYAFMDGWGSVNPNNLDASPRGTFNLMVYHMLMDKLKDYTINPLAKNDTDKETVDVITATEPTVDCYGNVITNDWANGVYTVKGLFECWENQLKALRTKVGCSSLEVEGGPENKKTGIRGQITKNGGKDDFGQIIKKAVSKVSRFKRKRVKRKINRKLNKEYNPQGGDPNKVEVAVHLVKDFLDCAGYTYVKILTPYNPTPLEVDRSGKVSYNRLKTIEKPIRYSMPEGESVRAYFSDPKYRKPATVDVGLDFYYYPLKGWSPKSVTIIGTTIKPVDQNAPTVFPNVRNPIYAFKYFEYATEGFRNYQSLEAENCYSDPNDCYATENGFIVEEPMGGFKTIPCCASSDGDLSFCFEDNKYPNINLLTVTNNTARVDNPSLFVKKGDPRYTFNSEGTKVVSKRIVDMFESGVRIKCPYDHYSWSSGQRYNFYNLLKLKQEDLNDPEEAQSEADAAEEAALKAYNCSSLFENREWFDNMPDGVLIDSNYSRYVTAVERTSIMSQLVGGNGISNKSVFPETFPNTSKRKLVSIVEVEMATMIGDCNGRCADREDEFRSKIIKYLNDNCYVIGGCKGYGETYENVIPEEDVEDMVRAIKSQCQAQCNTLNSVGCYEFSMREIDADKTAPGPMPFRPPTLLIGIGDVSQLGNDISDQLKLKYSNDFGPNRTSVDLDKDLTSDIVYYTVKDSPSYEDLEKFSWYQYTLLNQAMEWDFDVSLPSKCNSLILEAEGSTKVIKAIRTTSGVSEFKHDSRIDFGYVDFGTPTQPPTQNRDGSSIADPTSGLIGTKELVIHYKINNKTGPCRIFAKVIIDGNTVVGSAPLNPNETVTTIVLQRSINMTHRLEVVGVSSGDCTPESDYFVTIDWVKLGMGKFEGKEPYSNMQQYSPNATNTFIDKSQYEVNGAVIPDSKMQDATVKSPAININVTSTKPKTK